MFVKKRIVAYGICISLLAAGCGKNTGSTENAGIPTLKEPTALNESYRTVEYGSLGTTKVLLATAVPKDYCHYYDANVTISQIYVEPGDIVNAGDVLASCDLDEAKQCLEAAKSELEHENTAYNLSTQISVRQIELWNTMQQSVQNQPDEDGTKAVDTEEADTEEADTEEADTGETDIEEADIEEVDTDYLSAQLATQISIEKENASYDKKLHEYRVKKLNEQISSYQKIVDEGTIIASHSGLVTYTKKITSGRAVGAYENVVIVSDTDELLLEVKNTSVKDYKYSDYDKKYVMIEGQKYDVTEQQYSSEAMVLSKINELYPNLCITGNEEIPLEIGQMYPVYFQKTKVEKALVIGNDSLYKDDNSTYVYVKTEDGGREKRIIETGESDSNCTQIISGLKEGENVYYNSTDKVPTKYTEYVVKRSEFSIPNYGILFEKSDANTVTETSSYEGQIVSVNVAQDDNVEAGVLLYVVDTGEGKAAITDAENAISMEKSSYKSMIEELDKQLEDLKTPISETLINLQKQLAEVNHNYKLSQLQANYDRISKDNDGKGNISVYAKNAGKITKINVEAGDTVDVGSEIMQISGSSSDILLVRMKNTKACKVYTDNIADIGEKVLVKIDDISYAGTCIGFAVNNSNIGKGYITNDEKGVHLNNNSDSGYGMEAFYVKMDDGIPDKLASADAIEFSYVSIKDAVVLPNSLVHKQVNPLNESDISYYVWKVENGNVVKQLVDIADYTLGPGTLVLYGVEEGDTLAAE